MVGNSDMSSELFIDPQTIFTINDPAVKNGPIQMDGVKLACLSIPLKQSGQDDFGLLYCPAGTRINAVTTQNKMPAAPVVALRRNIDRYSATDAVVLCLNAGNANAGTGIQGAQAVIKINTAISDALSVPLVNVMPYSTGIIGVQLPLLDMLRKTAELTDTIANQEQASLEDWWNMSRAIHTTDKADKLFHLQFVIAGQQYKAVGFAKGAAMMHPNMATMLSFIITDFPLNSQQIEQCNRKCTNTSFNCISIDSDTSTNDCMSLVSINATDATTSPASFDQFQQQISKLYQQLAFSIVADAEGGTRVLRASVTHYKGKQMAGKCAIAIVSSLLIKTALTAADPNWGRLVMALGNALDEDTDIAQISIKIGNCMVLEQGQMVPIYDEQAVAKQMSLPVVDIGIMVQGNKELEARFNDTAVALGCDMTTEYVILNSEYRT